MSGEIPKFITTKGEEVYGQERPSNNKEKMEIQNLREFWSAEAFKKGEYEEGEKINSMADDEIVEYNKARPQKLKKAA